MVSQDLGTQSKTPISTIQRPQEEINVEAPQPNIVQVPKQVQEVPKPPAEQAPPQNEMPAEINQTKRDASKEAIQNAPAPQRLRIPPPPNWIDEGWLSVGRLIAVNKTGFIDFTQRHPDINITLAEEFMGLLENLRRAININDRAWIGYLRACGGRICLSESGAPENVPVGINYTEFYIINSTLKPRLISTGTKPGGTVEVRKIIEELPREDRQEPLNKGL